MVLDELRRMVSPHGEQIDAYLVDHTFGTAERPRIDPGAVCVVDGATPRLEAVIAAIISEVAAAKVLVLDRELDEQQGCALLAMGVKGFVRYADADAQLARALAALAEGGFWASRSLVSVFLHSITGGTGPRHLSGAQVSRREGVVLDAIVENLTNKEIAARLNISERTVKFHVSNLLAKFHVGRRADLVLLATRFQPSVH